MKQKSHTIDLLIDTSSFTNEGNVKTRKKKTNQLHVIETKYLLSWIYNVELSD